MPTANLRHPNYLQRLLLAPKGLKKWPEQMWLPHKTKHPRVSATSSPQGGTTRRSKPQISAVLLLLGGGSGGAQRRRRKARSMVSGMRSSSRCTGEATKGRLTGKRWLVSTSSWLGPPCCCSCSRFCKGHGTGWQNGDNKIGTEPGGEVPAYLHAADEVGAHALLQPRSRGVRTQDLHDLEGHRGSSVTPPAPDPSPRG